jgi:hypothetical protein
MSLARKNLVRLMVIFPGIPALLLITIVYGYAQERAPVDKNARCGICDLVQNPEKYSGTELRVRGILKPSMHATVLADPSCTRTVLLEYPENTNGATPLLVKDAHFREFELWLSKLRYRSDIASTNRVWVTVKGQFESIWQIKDGARVAVRRGFGDHSLGENRIVIYRVEEISVEPVESNNP